MMTPIGISRIKLIQFVESRAWIYENQLATSATNQFYASFKLAKYINAYPTAWCRQGIEFRASANWTLVQNVYLILCTIVHHFNFLSIIAANAMLLQRVNGRYRKMRGSP